MRAAVRVVDSYSLIAYFEGEAGKDGSEPKRSLISTLSIELVPADLPLTKQTAELKAKRKMSYADCFAAALAKVKKVELVTGDKEFRQVDGEVKIQWL